MKHWNEAVCNLFRNDLPYLPQQIKGSPCRRNFTHKWTKIKYKKYDTKKETLIIKKIN